MFFYLQNQLYKRDLKKSTAMGKLM